ncbi:SHE10 [Candida theae]|uniref:SHE10 n=1 Tax=Candida theae TaxID=1198502 RepID=A0AAD5FVT7_9ASCO|nr:SHE10 [Candida theae]KAI5948625.1 SHE10 [Candida theae]
MTSYRLITFGIVAYFLYAWTFVCPPISLLTATDEVQLSPINFHVCKVSDGYIRPYVQPVYDAQIKPILIELDDQWQLSGRLSRALDICDAFDEKYGVKAALDLVFDGLTRFYNWFEHSVLRYVQLWSRLGLLKAWYWINVARVNADHALQPIWTFVGQILHNVASIPIVGQVLTQIQDVYAQLINSPGAAKLHQRSLFIQKEVKNLIKFDEFSPREFKSSLIHVVKDLMGHKYEQEEAEDGWDSEEEEEQEGEVETIVLTSTVSVYEDGALVTENPEPELVEIYREIEHWQTKINKTLNLARINLESDLQPILNRSIEALKPLVSQEFQDLQQVNYKQYKDIHAKISQINKDVEKIQASNKTIRVETITRQEIRDDIAESYASTKNCSTNVQQLLSSTHEQLLVEYFNLVQSTIDILESFADSSINEFNSKISYLIQQQGEQLGDSQIWTIWKNFHQIKDQFFQFRDDLLTNANLYKRDNKTYAASAIGMENWNDYLKNVEFHLNFLIRDNADYLQLVRAKANLAFQAREELIYEMTNGEVDSWGQ